MSDLWNKTKDVAGKAGEAVSDTAKKVADTATDMARDYVAAGCRYDDPEYARIAALPVGVARKEAAPAAARKPRTRIVGTAR